MIGCCNFWSNFPLVPSSFLLRCLWNYYWLKEYALSWNRVVLVQASYMWWPLLIRSGPVRFCRFRSSSDKITYNGHVRCLRYQCAPFFWMYFSLIITAFLCDIPSPLAVVFILSIMRVWIVWQHSMFRTLKLLPFITNKKGLSVVSL